MLNLTHIMQTYINSSSIEDLLKICSQISVAHIDEGHSKSSWKKHMRKLFKYLDICLQ